MALGARGSMQMIQDVSATQTLHTSRAIPHRTLQHTGTYMSTQESL